MNRQALKIVGCDHLGGCVLTGDPRCHTPKLWTELLKKYAPRSLIDIGCGAGHAVEWWLSRNVRAEGVDGFVTALMEATRRNPGLTECLFLHDYTRGPWPQHEETTWDLGWCCEFVEHVEENYRQCFLETFRRCRSLAMTHALPGQDGFHHVNCQPDEYWIEQVTNAGLIYDQRATEHCRRVAEPNSFASQSLLIFTNRRIPHGTNP